jgi:hypothetical protein
VRYGTERDGVEAFDVAQRKRRMMMSSSAWLPTMNS